MSRHPLVTGAVLAGGRARRMGGADKALLHVGSGVPRTILSTILETFQGRFAESIVVTSAATSIRNPQGAGYEGHPAKRVSDQFEDCGPLGGIHAALAAASTPFVFVCGCDMPYLCGPLLDLMAVEAVRADRTPGDRLLVPLVGGRPEPLHAIYPTACLADADRALREGVRMMIEFFGRVPVDWLAEERFSHIEGAARSFRNLNTPEDLQAER